MSTDSRHIEIRLDADPRFAAAAAGGARYLGEASGLSVEASSKLQSAVLFACEETFSHLHALDSQIAVTLYQFADRIEVTIVHAADAPSIGLDTLIRSASSPVEGVDRVQYERIDGSSLTRLTKFIGPHA